MKIKPEHFKIIKSAIAKVHENMPNLREIYANAGLSPKRFRWDCLWRSEINGKPSCSFICDVLYSYVNNDHIDTALRKIVKELWIETPEECAVHLK